MTATFRFAEYASAFLPFLSHFSICTSHSLQSDSVRLCLTHGDYSGLTEVKMTCSDTRGCKEITPFDLSQLANQSEVKSRPAGCPCYDSVQVKLSLKIIIIIVLISPLCGDISDVLQG